MQPNNLNATRVVFRATASIAIALVAFASVQPRLAAQSAYQIVKFDVPGAAGTSPSAINDSGVIVGYYQTVNSSNEATFQGFERTPDGQIITLTYPGTAEDNNYARGINSAGLIVGTYFNASDINQGCVYNGTGYVTLDIRNGPTSLFGISNNGLLVGLYSPSTSTQPISFVRFPSCALLPILFPGSTFSWPYGVNDQAEAVGIFGETSGSVAGSVFSPNQGCTQLNMPGANGTYPAGINDARVIVGDYYDQNEDQYVGFILNAGQYTSISIPGANSTYPTGINSKGDIAGYYWDDQAVPHGFLLAARGSSQSRLKTSSTADFRGTLTFNCALATRCSASESALLWLRRAVPKRVTIATGC